MRRMKDRRLKRDLRLQGKWALRSRENWRKSKPGERRERWEIMAGDLGYPAFALTSDKMATFSFLVIWVVLLTSATGRQSQSPFSLQLIGPDSFTFVTL